MSSDTATTQPHLLAAASQFAITPEASVETDNRTGARVEDVVGPLNTTVTLLDDGSARCCIITTHFGPSTPVNVSDLFRQAVAQELNLPKSHVLLFTSHNHSSVPFASNGVPIYATNGQAASPAKLLPIGEQFLATLERHARQLPELLEPVTVWWAEGHEDRITYNRKGRRADGTTYFMREQDRLLLGDDFHGDIDTQAPVVVLRNQSGQVIAALTQFTGHPVTSYHPEKPVAFGDWPQVACDVLAGHLEEESAVPVGFMQGCAGDVNSLEMFFGGVDRATQFGQMLGQSYVDALDSLSPSKRDGLDFAAETVQVPLAPLPSRDVLNAELAEMDDFIQRARSGDENTLACVGLNFPRALSPAYRAELVQLVRAWNVWALDVHAQGQAESMPQHLKMEISVLRIGDVGIVGLPCEPFQGIGRQIRDGSPLPLSIPCGYMNVSHGYITDGPNTGDREYMSSFYRYTRFRPPLKKPAGDVLADRAVRILNQFAKEPAHRS
jgi:hypothetical protein